MTEPTPVVADIVPAECPPDRNTILMQGVFSMHTRGAPSAGCVRQALKDGYWDRTDVIELADGSRRVRKRTKGATAPGPWGVGSLRREIQYLVTLPEGARAMFPPVLTAWDDESVSSPDVGYEMPYYDNHVDAGELSRRGALAQEEIDVFQDALADSVLGGLHEPVRPAEPMSAHVVSVVRQALAGLEAEPTLAALISAPSIDLNGAHVRGPRAAFDQIVRETDALRSLDSGPCVRLHGDFFLENILWRPAGIRGTSEAPRLILVDPVSVAGATRGPPLFDLVKYESYAVGELLALRSEWVDVAGFTSANDDSLARDYRFRIRWENPALRRFLALDWRTRFRRAFEAKYGPVDRRLARFLDGYFSVVMAVNTKGDQQRARLLKATTEFNAVLTGN